MDYFIEIAFSIALFLNASLFVPQAIRLFKNKNSRDVSLTTFFGFLLIQGLTLVHGVLKKDYILIFGTLLSIFACGFVNVLIIYYRFKPGKPKNAL